MPIIRYIPISGRYRVGPSGRLLPVSAVRRGIDRLADEVSDRMADLTERVIAREIGLAGWQRRMMQLEKDALIAATVVAKGGRDRMTPSDWGWVGRKLQDEYAYLRRFALQLSSGEQPPDGRAVARARLYGQQARVAYEQMRGREERHLGYDEERNVLQPAEHCDQCRELADLGWVAVGTLPPIGTRTCLSNCRCTIERRRAAEVREAVRHLRRVV